MKYWHIRGNKDDLRCSLVSMLILYETCFNPPRIVPVRVTKLPTTFFMFTKVPSTYLDQWLALSINFPRDLILRHLLPDWKRKKNLRGEASREVVWGGKRVAEPGGIPLMSPIRPPAILIDKLKLVIEIWCHHVSPSAYYVAFVKKKKRRKKKRYLNSKWSRKSASKEIYLTSIANSSTTSYSKEK